MEIVLPYRDYYCFTGVLDDDDWIYFIGEESTTLQKVNVMTGEVIELEKLPGMVSGYHMIKC